MQVLRHPIASIRANPRLAVGSAAFALLTLAWLGWAIYVASDRGVNEGLGVLVAWPALLIAAAILSLPFVGGYLLLKRSVSEGDQAPESEGLEEPEEETATS